MSNNIIENNTYFCKTDTISKRFIKNKKNSRIFKYKMNKKTELTTAALEKHVSYPIGDSSKKRKTQPLVN